MKLLYFLTFANGLRGNFKKKKSQSNLQSKDIWTTVDGFSKSACNCLQKSWNNDFF